jgi:hypothetical protein
MRCSIAVLFTCVLVLRCPLSREGACVKHESLEQTARYWVGQDKQEGICGREQAMQSNLRTSHDRRICELLQESSRSSMYKVYDNVIYAKDKKTEMS